MQPDQTYFKLIKIPKIIHLILERNLSYSVFQIQTMAERGGSVAVDFLVIVTPIVGVCNVICFVVRYFMSILVLQSS